MREANMPWKKATQNGRVCPIHFLSKNGKMSNERIYLAKAKKCFNKSKLKGPGGVPLRGFFAQMLYRKTYRDEGRAWLVIAKKAASHRKSQEKGVGNCVIMLR